MEGARQDGREGATGGRAEAMMWGRVGTGVEEGRVVGGRGRVRKERRHGRSEGTRGGRKRAGGGGSNGPSERRKGGAWEEGK